MSAVEEQEQLKPATAEQLGLGQGADLPPTQRVDYDNWTLPPYNRWSFQRMQQFTRTGRISRAPDPALLHENPQPLDGINFTDSQGSSTSIAEMLERTWTDGFLVLHRGEVITEQYFNGMESDTLHLMMSCSKSMTSALMGTVIAEGLLDTQALLSVYVPELVATGMAHATVQQALDMQVGLKFEEDYSDLNGEWRNLEIATGWRAPAPGYSGPTDLLAYTETLKDSAGPHGAVFHYQSILSDALALSARRAAAWRGSGPPLVRRVTRHAPHRDDPRPGSSPRYDEERALPPGRPIPAAPGPLAGAPHGDRQAAGCSAT